MGDIGSHESMCVCVCFYVCAYIHEWEYVCLHYEGFYSCMERGQDGMGLIHLLVGYSLTGRDVAAEVNASYSPSTRATFPEKVKWAVPV